MAVRHYDGKKIFIIYLCKAYCYIILYYSNIMQNVYITLLFTRITSEGKKKFT